MFKRSLSPAKSKSYFLFGPRQTGKSTFVKGLLKPEDLYIDLLPQRNYLAYLKQPGRFRQEILAHYKRHGKFTCVIDEIQKVPLLLDEVHELIESKRIRFILTGSSARKLKRGASNLLAGRAYTYHMKPLTFQELGENFNLEKALHFGSLPPLWNVEQEEDPVEFLRSYSETYLREEIQEEGLVRNIGPFSQFLDVAAVNDGEIVNYSNIARECFVSVKTVQQYYQILEDTFIALRIPAWTKSVRKRLVTHPRYYFVDPGITNALCHNLNDELNSAIRGRRFEQFVILQIEAMISYKRLDYQLSYWRTNHGSEIDLIISRGNKLLAAVEIKSSLNISTRNLTGVKSFSEDNPQVPIFVLGIDQKERMIGKNVTVLSWDHFIMDRLSLE